MNKQGPIIVIDNDADDRLIIHATFADLNITNRIVFLASETDAIAYVRDTGQTPFMVFCRIADFKAESRSLRRRLLNREHNAVPFVFLSCSNAAVPKTNAYHQMLSYHSKPTDLIEWRKLLSYNIQYWSHIS